MIKALFGGTFGYIQAGAVAVLGGMLLFFYADHKATKRENESLKRDAFWHSMETRLLLSVNASLADSAERRGEAQAGQTIIERTVYEQAPSNDCAGSAAVRSALDGVRDRHAERAAVATDQRRAIPLPRQPENTD